MSDMTWHEHQKWENDWWGDCTKTFAEETKQISYAYRMGLQVMTDPLGKERWPMYDADGKSILDVGGGPVSMLLKTFNLGEGYVVDPGDYPDWVKDRYALAGIEYMQGRAEEFDAGEIVFDEVWLYNCLQHVKLAPQVAINARHWGKVLRVFEWLNIPACPGHPWELKQPDLDEWFGGSGTIEQMNGENGCYGTAYFGTFGG